MAITPDTKDWTWVLERPCPECGFDSSRLPADEVATTLRDNALTWPATLASPTVRLRPAPDTWSPLEYACHVRDVYRLFDERLQLMLGGDDVRFANWNQDDTAVEGRYAEQEPVDVGADLVAAAGVIADRFDDVSGRQWQRTGTRSDGAVFTVESFARYLVHDVVHHVHDVNPPPGPDAPRTPPRGHFPPCFRGVSGGSCRLTGVSGPTPGRAWPLVLLRRTAPVAAL